MIQLQIKVAIVQPLQIQTKQAVLEIVERNVHNLMFDFTKT